jgi:hypothetical protein
MWRWGSAEPGTGIVREALLRTVSAGFQVSRPRTVLAEGLAEAGGEAPAVSGVRVPEGSVLAKGLADVEFVVAWG